MHVDDAADAAVFLMLNYDEPEIINVGVGTDTSIRELTEIVCRVVGFQGQLCFDTSKPDGMPRKLLDVSRLNTMGWHARIGLEQGIAATYASFLEHDRRTMRSLTT